jgi:hypothetical protein
MTGEDDDLTYWRYSHALLNPTAGRSSLNHSEDKIREHAKNMTRQARTKGSVKYLGGMVLRSWFNFLCTGYEFLIVVHL